MDQPPKKTNPLALAVIGLLPLILAGRGVYAFVTGSYWSAPRNSPAVEYTGVDASLLGGATIALAAMIAVWIVFELGRVTKKQAALISGLCLALSAVLYALVLWG